MKSVSRALMVGIDISSGEDTAVLIVGDPNKKPAEVLMAFQGQEAIDLYNKLIGVNKKDDTQ